ncbi:MAG: DUF4445 domain-containing protein [Rhodospirillales bacterium]|nr:DUF4445 domain-containing protein [Rhodospirillales bacterium]
MPKVTFLPAARTVEARRGDTALTAAWKAGVGIKSVCGGRGTCGSCLVTLEAQAVRTVNKPTRAERERLPPDSTEHHYRLACQCEIAGEVTLSVPPESEAVKSAPRTPFTHLPIAAHPVASRMVIEPEGPNTHPPRALAERIKDALTCKMGKRRFKLAADVVADFSQEPQFDGAPTLTATLYRERAVIQLRKGRHDKLYGLAIDVGTTSIVVFLCDLVEGAILASRAAGNPQAIFGEDVISRMTHIQKDIGALRAMRQALIDELNRLIGEMAAETGVAAPDIVDAVLVGNPTMQHIVLGISPEPLGRGPYLPVWSEGVEAEAQTIGLAIAPRAKLFVFPMLSGYIGGDILAAVLTRGRDFYRGTQLLVDIGTNGEVVLAHDGQLMATSCATGPVYEGAHIRCGVRAQPGAIERVWVDGDSALQCATIPDPRSDKAARPIGLCGSGVISSVAALVAAGLIAPDGNLALPARHPALRPGESGRTEEIVLAPATRSQTGRDIVLTQKDVRGVQLGKSSLRAGIEILMAAMGATTIDRIHLAGTFGNHLEPEDILKIGLVPKVDVERVQSIGNAAGDGARLALFNRHQRQRVLSLARRVEVLELSGRADFHDLFVAHTELASEPLSLEETSGAS